MDTIFKIENTWFNIWFSDGTCYFYMVHNNNNSWSLFCVAVCLCVYLWLRWGVYLAADSQCRGGGDRSGPEPMTGGGQRDGTVDQEWNHCWQQTHGHRLSHTHSYPHLVKAQSDTYYKHLIQLLLKHQVQQTDFRRRFSYKYTLLLTVMVHLIWNTSLSGVSLRLW